MTSTVGDEFEHDRRIPGNAEVITAVKDLMGKHVEDKHLDFDKDAILEMYEEHRELYDEVAPLARDTNAKVTLLVDDMYGSPHPTAADPEHREGGWVPVLRSMQEEGINVHRTWSPSQWVFFGSIGAAFITTCGVIIAAVVGG